VRERFSENKAFTLMEVIVSVFVMSIIVITVLPVYTSIMSTKSGMEASGVREMREAQALMNLIREDLKSAFPSENAGEDKFIMVNNRDFEGKALDEMHFTSYSYPTLNISKAASDQSEVGYFVEDNGEKRTLVRRADTIIDSDITVGGEAIELTDSIDYFDVDPYTGGDFEALEAATITSMPSGVLIRIGLKAEDGSVSDYVTAMDLPSYIVTVKKEEEPPADGTADDGAGENAGDSEQGN
jgi:type II secretory pathway component PulJ